MPQNEYSRTQYEFQCKNGDCDEEEAVCCITCEFKVRVHKCCETGKTLVQTQNAHDDACALEPMETRGLETKLKDDIDAIRKQHKAGSFGPGLIRDALMDLNYSEEQLPKVAQVENYVSY